MMVLASGILSFSAVVIGIINARLQKAKTAASREKVISITFSIGATAFPLVGFILWFGFDAERAALWFFVFGTILVSIDYLWSNLPSTRGQTFILLLSWFATVSLFFLYWLGRIIGIIERIVDAIKR